MVDALEVKQFLARSVIFHGASDAALVMAAEAAQQRHFESGALIFREGDPGEAMYVIRDGRVKISKANLDGRERIFTILGSYEVVGEMAVISSEPRTATATCLDHVVALVLYRDDVRLILERFPSTLWNLARVLTLRLAEMNREVEMLSFASSQACVAHALHALYLQGAFIEGPDGQPTIQFTHQDVANRTGSSRETVTRVLREFERAGVVKTKPGLISLLKPEALDPIVYGLSDEGDELDGGDVKTKPAKPSGNRKDQNEPSGEL